jgi:hypothetical protein
VFVLTVDQVESRHRPDLVAQALTWLADVDASIPFARTVGDEFQGALTDAAPVVATVLALLRGDEWHVGLGIGAVEHPWPADTRSARGPAFLAARTAVERAKSETSHVSIVSAAASGTEAADCQVVLELLAALRRRRSPQGWEAVEAMRGARHQADAASRLGISRQALSQRLRAASWALEQRTLPVLARLLTRADEAATSGR